MQRFNSPSVNVNSEFAPWRQSVLSSPQLLLGNSSSAFVSGQAPIAHQPLILSPEPPKFDLNSLILEILNSVFESHTVLQDDETNLLRWRVALMSLSPSALTCKLLNQRHIPFIQWTAARCSNVYLTARTKEQRDSHIRYQLFYLELALQSAWAQHHASYGFSFVLQETHNELMHALNGNVHVGVDAIIFQLSMCAIETNPSGVDYCFRWCSIQFQDIDLDSQLALVHELVEIRDLFRPDPYRYSGFAPWLKANWNQIMHALNGNTTRADFQGQTLYGIANYQQHLEWLADNIYHNRLPFELDREFFSREINSAAELINRCHGFGAGTCRLFAHVGPDTRMNLCHYLVQNPDHLRYSRPTIRMFLEDENFDPVPIDNMFTNAMFNKRRFKYFVRDLRSLRGCDQYYAVSLCVETYFTSDPFSAWVSKHRNKIMHALNGNVVFDKQAWQDEHVQLITRFVGLATINPDDPVLADIAIQLIYSVAALFRGTRDDLVERAVWPAVYRAVFAHYIIVLRIDGGWSERLAAAHNAMMHAYNGNLSARSNRAKKRRGANAAHRAYLFEHSDPNTWKFGLAEAEHFLNSHRDHLFVLDLGVPKVAELMMRRRGVKPSLAFHLAYTAYKVLHVVHSSLVDIEDTSFVRGVVRKSGIFSSIKSLNTAMMPDLKLEPGDKMVNLAAETQASFLVGTENVASGFTELSSTLKGISDKVMSFAESTSAKIPSLTTDYLASLIGGEYGKSPFVLRLLKVLRDIIVAWNMDSTAGAVALATLFAETAGTGYALLITGCVTLMKQFTKWCDVDLVTRKGFGDVFTLASSLFSPLLGLITGSVFNITKTIPFTNSVFTFAKNLSTPLDYLASAVKQVVNYVWKFCTGHELYVSETDQVLRELKLVKKNIVAGISGNVDHDVLAGLKHNALVLQKLLVRLQASDASTEKKREWAQLTKSLIDYIASCGVETEMMSTKPRTTVGILYGATGVGKTSVPALISAAVGAVLHWPGEVSHWHSQFSLRKEGFQVPLPAYCRSVQIDEPFSNKDSTVAAEELTNFLLFVGINPFQVEGATLDHKNDFARALITWLTYNQVPTELGVHNPEAGHRRPDLKFELLSNFDDPFARLEDTHIDKIWTFLSAKQKFTFTQVVSMVVQKISEYSRGSENFEAAKVALSKTFQPVFVVPTKATSLVAQDDSVRGNLAKAIVHSPVSPPPVHVSGITSNPGPSQSSPSISDIKRKGKITQSVYDLMKTDLSYDEINELLSHFPEGNVTTDYIRRHFDANCPSYSTSDVDVAECLGRALDLSPTVAESLFSQDECVVRKKGAGCLIHPRPLVCMQKLKKSASPLVALDPNSYYSYLLKKGKFIGAKIDDVLTNYCGAGLEKGLFLALVGVAGLAALKLFFSGISTVFSVVSQWLFSDYVERKAYGNQYAVQAHRTFNLPAHVPLQVHPVVQKSHVIHSKHGRNESMNQLFNRTHIMVNTLFQFGESVRTICCQVQTIAGRLGVTVRHGFEQDGLRPKLMVLPPPYAKLLHVKQVDGYHENDDMFVQTEYDAVQDQTFVIFPIGLNIFVDTTDKYISRLDFNASLFQNAQLFYKPTLEMEVADDFKSLKCVPTKLSLLSMSAGRFVGLNNIEFHDGGRTIAIEFCGGPEPPDGACGGAIAPLESHFGERYLGVFLNGYSKGKRSTFASFLTREDISDFLKKHPNVNRGIKISDSNDIEMKEIVADFSHKCDIAVASRPGFLPNDAGLYRSPIYGCLTGVTFEVDGVPTVVPPPQRVPSPVRDVAAGFKKYPVFLPPLSPTIHDDLKSCAIDVALTIIQAGRDFPFKRGDFLSRDEALNGTADGSVIGMNMDSSAGYSPMFKGKQGNKHDFYEQIDGKWVVKPFFAIEDDEMWTSIQDGTYMYYVSKTTPKGELRMPQKVTRLTSSKPCMYLENMRRIFAPVQALIAFGAPRNGTARAVDPTGPSGVSLQQLFNTYLKKIDGDAKVFDASQCADLVNICCPIILFMLLCFVYPTIDRPLLRRLAEWAAVANHLSFELVGDKYYLHIDGNISGCLLTTDINDFISGICLRMSWLIFYRSQSKLTGGVWVEFHKHVRYATQGDDIGGCTDADFNLFDMEKGYAVCGIKFTSSDKDAVVLPYAPKVEFLKRTQALFNGRLVGRLPFTVIHEIISYIRVRVQGREDATLENVHNAFLEILVYGRSAYETCFTVVNENLALHGCPLFRHTYDDLLSTWSTKFSSSLTKIGSLPSKMSQTLINTSNVNPAFSGVVRKSRAATVLCSMGRLAHRDFPFPYSTDLLIRRFKKRVSDTKNVSDSTVKVEADGSDRAVVVPALKEAKGLTQFIDGLRKVDITAPSISSKIRNFLDPYPDQNVRDILMREYPLGTFPWRTTDLETNYSPIYQANLPEDLFSIPKIAATLTSFRYLNTAVRISIRINATPFTQGRLMIRYIPAYNGGDWRGQFPVAMQSEHALLSPSSAETCEVTIPWVAPFTFLDLQDSGKVGFTGRFQVFVLHPLRSASSVALADMIVNVFASFVDPIVAGLDLTDEPGTMVRGVSRKAEAIEKVMKGVLTTATKVGGLVSGGLNAAKSLGSIAMLFDKPFTVAAPQPVIPRMGADLVNVQGLAQGIMLSADPTAKVATEPGLIGSDDPHGTLSKLMRRPGVLFTGSIAVADDPATADPYFNFPVQPAFCFKFSLTDTYISTTPLAYYSHFFRYWRGSLKYKIIFSASKMTSARVRVAFIPNYFADGTIPENRAGDVTSAVIVINGDTEFECSVPFLSDTLYKEIELFNPTSATLESTIGRLSMTLVSPIATAPGNTGADIYFTVYVAAGEDFQVLRPDGWENAARPVLSPIAPPPPMTPIDPVTRRVMRKSFVTKDFEKPFPGLVPTKSFMEDKLCSPDGVQTVVELLRRFELVGVGPVNDTFLNGNFSTFAGVDYYWHSVLTLPFLTYRGGMNWKIMKHAYTAAVTAGTPLATTWSVPSVNKLFIFWDFGTGTDQWPDLNGQIINDLTFNPWVEFNTPNYDNVYCRSMINPLQVEPDHPKFRIMVDNVDDGAGEYFDTYAAVADDFSLGPFVGCPIVDYSLAAPAVNPRVQRPHKFSPVTGTSGDKGKTRIITGGEIR